VGGNATILRINTDNKVESTTLGSIRALYN